MLLIEQSHDVVERVARRPTASSGSSPTRARSTSLRDAGLERCDVVVAATGDDEDNLVISLLAKQEFGVPRVIARVNHPKNEWLFNENWGVDLSVSTPHLITALVEEAVSVGRLVRILQFEGGNVRLVEVTLAEDAPVVDKAIKDLDIPRDATIVAVVRERARRDAARRHRLRSRRRSARDGHRATPKTTSARSSPAAESRPAARQLRPELEQRVDRVVDHALLAVVLATTPSSTTRRPGDMPDDLAAAEEHRGHRRRDRR